MKTYRMNAVMTGVLYFLGTVFGVLCYVVGGEMLTSLSSGKPLAGWAYQFEGLTITLEENGDTLLSGTVADQAALHSLLKKVRDFGMPLVSVIQVQFNETHPNHSKQGE